MSSRAHRRAVGPSTLLYNDECSVCRGIARWVQASQRSDACRAALRVVPIGDDPLALRAMHPGLDIWDAYATIHLLMPDGSMRIGGEAVAGVLRLLPRTRWLAGAFSFSILGRRPFQGALNAAYAVLSAVRPLFGCESCGIPSPWLRPFVALVHRLRALFQGTRPRPRIAHFASLSPRAHRVPPVASV
jgi:predicted DCC family thiol-disulfide oxidoreductase YuxK